MTQGQNERPMTRLRSKEKDVIITKVVIRRLPPTLTAEQFLEQISPIPENNFLYFVKGDMSLGQNAFSRAYINFTNADDIINFKDKFDGYVFMNNKGDEFPAVVEFAPFQKIPKQKQRRRDTKIGTIEEDSDYTKFLEELSKPTEVVIPSVDNWLEEIEAKERLQKVGAAKVTTPLIEYIKQKKLAKIKLREERREERRRREMERQKLREKERRRKRLEKEKAIVEKQQRVEQENAKQQKKSGTAEKSSKSFTTKSSSMSEKRMEQSSSGRERESSKRGQGDITTKDKLQKESKIDWQESEVHSDGVSDNANESYRKTYSGTRRDFKNKQVADGDEQSHEKSRREYDKSRGDIGYQYEKEKKDAEKKNTEKGKLEKEGIKKFSGEREGSEENKRTRGGFVDKRYDRGRANEDSKTLEKIENEDIKYDTGKRSDTSTKSDLTGRGEKKTSEMQSSSESLSSVNKNPAKQANDQKVEMVSSNEQQRVRKPKRPDLPRYQPGQRSRQMATTEEAAQRANNNSGNQTATSES